MCAVPDSVNCRFEDQNITAWRHAIPPDVADRAIIDGSALPEMNLTINHEDRVLTIEQAGGHRAVSLYSREANRISFWPTFCAVSRNMR